MLLSSSSAHHHHHHYYLHALPSESSLPLPPIIHNSYNTSIRTYISYWELWMHHAPCAYINHIIIDCLLIITNYDVVMCTGTSTYWWSWLLSQALYDKYSALQDQHAEIPDEHERIKLWGSTSIDSTLSWSTDESNSWVNHHQAITTNR